MNIFKTYKDTERKLVDVEIELLRLKNDLDFFSRGPKDVQAQNYEISNGSKYIVPVEELYITISKLKETIDTMEEYQRNLLILKREIEKQVKVYTKRFNDIEMLVFMKHHIEKKPLSTVAEETNYSYGTIRNTNSKICQFIKNNVAK